MPREKIDLDLKLESLSILDADGNVDERLEPDLDDADLRRLFKAMLTARRFDERMLKLQRQGRIGTYGPCLGQEAASLGPAFAMTADDWLIPSFRETAAMLWRGWPMDKIILWWGGNEEGAKVPDGVNDLPICVPVASQVLHTGGIAFGLKLGGTRNVAIGFCGDGGTSEGDFHEGMNCAGAYQLPMIVVIQNNHWAISVPVTRQSRTPLYLRPSGFGIPGVQIDGNDVLASYAVTTASLDAARSGGGPQFIEALTYRMGAHTTSDDPTKYRDDAELDFWVRHDPIVRFEAYLRSRGADDAFFAELAEEAHDAANDIRLRTLALGVPDASSMFTHVYTEPHSLMQEQQAWLEAYEASFEGGAS